MFKNNMEQKTEIPTTIEEKIEKPAMIELNIQVNDLMNYTVNIPRVITPQTFPEIVKRIRSILAIMPKEDLSNKRKKGVINPILVLGKDELLSILKSYEKFSKEEFFSFILTNYNMEYTKRENIVSLMGRVRKRIKKLSEEEEDENRE